MLDSSQARGDMEAAATALSKLMKVAQDASDLAGQARSAASLGVIAQKRHAYLLAADHFKISFQAAQMLGARQMLDVARANVGLARGAGAARLLKEAIERNDVKALLEWKLSRSPLGSMASVGGAAAQLSPTTSRREEATAGKVPAAVGSKPHAEEAARGSGDVPSTTESSEHELASAEFRGAALDEAQPAGPSGAGGPERQPETTGPSALAAGELGRTPPLMESPRGDRQGDGRDDGTTAAAATSRPSTPPPPAAADRDGQEPPSRPCESTAEGLPTEKSEATLAADFVVDEALEAAIAAESRG